MTGEKCANCGAQIGALEQPFLFRDHVVCGKCHEKLTGSSPPPPPPTAPAPPLAYTSAPIPREKMITIQQTGKLWKLQLLLSGLTLGIGIIMVAVGVSQGHMPNLVGGGILLFSVGFVWYLVVRFLAWWFHG